MAIEIDVDYLHRKYLYRNVHTAQMFDNIQ